MRCRRRVFLRPSLRLECLIDQRLDRTVDVISYTVQALDPILELREAAPGSGRACGSAFLNFRFEEILNQRFKNDRKWMSDPQILEEAMDHFENQTKVRFNGKKGDSIPMFGLGPQPGIKRNRLELSSTDIKKIFEPVINEILILIEDQIKETAKKANMVKLILLVGGFGESRYLQTRIQEKFGAHIEVKVSLNRFVPAYHDRKLKFWSVLTANASQTAVVRGALMKGLAEVKGLTTKLPRIGARKARKHYGTECVTPFKQQRSPNDVGHTADRKCDSLKEYLTYFSTDNHRIPHPFAGPDHVCVMKWFLYKVLR